MRRWWRGVHAALRDDEVLTRGTWRIVLMAIIVGGSVCMAIAGFVGDPPETVPAALLLVFAVLLGTLMADHVAVDDNEVVNFRAMPIGTSRTARASIDAVGWSKQPMGFMAPALVLRDNTHVVLTALGRQTLWGPSGQAEMLAERLGVATAGQLPPRGVMSMASLERRPRGWVARRVRRRHRKLSGSTGVLVAARMPWSRGSKWPYITGLGAATVATTTVGLNTVRPGPFWIPLDPGSHRYVVTFGQDVLRGQITLSQGDVKLLHAEPRKRDGTPAAAETCTL